MVPTCTILSPTPQVGQMGHDGPQPLRFFVGQPHRWALGDALPTPLHARGDPTRQGSGMGLELVRRSAVTRAVRWLARRQQVMGANYDGRSTVVDS